MDRDIRKQIRWARFQLAFALGRLGAWTLLATLYALHHTLPRVAVFDFTGPLFTSVAFVALISIYANAMTDATIAMASYSSLIAALARRDVANAKDDLSRQILDTVEGIERREQGE